MVSLGAVISCVSGYEQQFKPWARSEDGQRTAEALSIAGIALGVLSATGVFAPVAGPLAVVAGLASAAISCVDGINFDCALSITGLGLAGAGKLIKHLPRYAEEAFRGLGHLTSIWGYHVDFITLVNIYANYRRRELDNET